LWSDQASDTPIRRSADPLFIMARGIGGEVEQSLVPVFPAVPAVLSSQKFSLHIGR
jgi:hypothetical protein